MRLVGPPLAPSPFDTIPQALEAAAKRADAGLTLIDAREAETPVPFDELLASARLVSGALLDLGVKPGDRVALVLPTGRDFLDAFFGAQLAGAVPVPLYPPVRLGRMDEYVRATARMLTVVDARAVLTDRRVRLLLGQAVEQARPRFGAPTVSELRERGVSHTNPTSGDALGVIQFSSGSTVDPKPVGLTHRNLLAQLAAIKATLDRTGPHRAGVSWLPLYHDMGLIGCLLLAAYYPGWLALLPPEVFLARPALWLRALSRHRGSISPAPNFAYGLCLKRVADEDLEGVDLSSWTHALNGAEPVSADTARRFCERFARYGFRPEAMMPVYGLSEASLAVTFSSATEPVRAMGVDAATLSREGVVRPGGRELVSVGRAVPGAELELRDDQGAVLPEGKVGRLWVRAPFVMEGYVGNPQATASALVDGWLDTGDLGFVEGGELFICGRAKDLVIIRGANHAPQEFEECLEGLHGVRTGCAVALGWVPPGEADEALLLLVEALADAPLTLAEQVVEAVVQRTGIKPSKVELLPPGTLPRTSSGKLRRGLALRQYLEGTLAPPKPVTTLSMTKEVAKSALGFARRRLR